MKLLVLFVSVTVCHAAIQMEIPSRKFGLFGDTKVNRTPVILVPGDGGSRVYARVEDPFETCPGGTNWFLIWLNIKFLTLFTERCLPKYFQLKYNRTTRKTHDQPGVQTKIFHWGDTQSIELLDEYNFGYSRYFFTLVKALVKRGYVRGVDLRGAPFDFRRAPNDNVDFVPKMKELVEDTYTKNRNRRVMIMAHSLGNLYTLLFLKNMAPAWKKKYIRSYSAVSAPFAGALKPLKLMTSGDTLSEFIFFKSYMREVERSMPSTMFLMPSPQFWSSDEVLVSRPSRNYTVKDYHQLFTDIKDTDAWEMYKDTSHIIDPKWIPDVDELYCYHGVGVPTAARYVWSKDSEFPDTEPKMVLHDGDGTVNIRSLRVCHEWPGVHLEQYPGVKHKQILHYSRFINAVTQVLMQPDTMDRKES